MTSPPQVITRALTFRFAKSVSVSTGLPDVMEVAILPLGEASMGGQATYGGGLKSQTVELSGAVNTCEFHLIPTYSSGLTAPITYRVMWRAGLTGRTYTHDFAMPDEDLTWDELAAGVGNVIDGDAYLQADDLGVPGRVARLDDQGRVIDAMGIPVVSSDDLSVLEATINVETVDRQRAITLLRSTLETELYQQTDATLTSAQAYTNTRAATLGGRIDAEVSARRNADTDAAAAAEETRAYLQEEIDSLVVTTGGTSDALFHKADLDENGLVLLDQIPPDIYTNVIPVPTEAAMLALTYPTASRGDIAVRPDGIWVLTNDDPTQLGNWVGLSIINSVNGHRGAVVLTAADVGAIPVGGAITMGQVTGLSTALLGKTNASDFAALQSAFTSTQAILSNPAIATFIDTGLLPDAVMPTDIALVNTSGQVTDKSGNVVAAGGGGGAVASVNSKVGVVVLSAADVGAIPAGPIAQTQVTGLLTDLGNRVLVNDARLTNARTPVAHAASHQVNGSDVLTLGQSQVTGLSGIVSNNALTSNSNAVNRIGSLEGRVTTLEGGGGGEGGGVSTTAVFYDSANTTTDVVDFSQVYLHSPWGIDSDGTITGTPGTWYYLHAGVRSEDVAYPWISPGGHLRLYRWNEANPPDPVWALAGDLIATNATVSTKANQSDLAALSSTVDTKAAAADLSALSTTVSSKASQSALNNTNATVATKANQSDLTALTNTVATKASQSGLEANSASIVSINNTLTTKADLTAGRVPNSQTSNTIPISYVSGLTPYLSRLNATTGAYDAAYLSNWAGVSAGAIDATKISGLNTVLTNKADLDGSGKIPTSQLPALSLTAVVPVVNKAALLALTTTQVQPGDVGVITTGPDKGSYILTSADPSTFANWQLLSTPDAPVNSINGQTGTVVLSYSDVGAMAANASMPIGQVNGLQSALDAKATVSSLVSGLAGKASPTDVQNMLFTSGLVKYADYVATSAIASLAGLQSVDSVVVPAGAVVLCTAQSSSVFNGLWTVVSGGAWTRPADFATGSWLTKHTMVLITNTTGGTNGTNNNNTLWKQTATSGFIDTNLNNWTRTGYIAPSLAPVSGNGIHITGTYPALNFAAKTTAGGGLLATSDGLSVDRNLNPGKYVGTVPAGNIVAGITHGLNTTSPVVQIYEVASNQQVLAGVTVTSANAISIEFSSAPATNQYRVVILG